MFKQTEGYGKIFELDHLQHLKLRLEKSHELIKKINYYALIV